MAELDYTYLCTTIGSLSGLPIRIFQGNTQTDYFSMVELPQDPMSLYRQDIFSISDHVGYYVTPEFHYYGILNGDGRKIVVGPTRQFPESPQELRELAFRLDLGEEDTRIFSEGMHAIVRMPIESILQMLCTVNYVLSGEKLGLEDLIIYDQEQSALSRHQETQRAARKLSLSPDSAPIAHNTHDLEQLLLGMVRKGDTSTLRKWLSSAPAVRAGVVANDPLRQQKNLFIVTVTLVSRSAIQGGMEVDDAFTLSDFYIQQCELLPSPERVANLQYRMVLDYTSRVERLHLGSHASKLVVDVANYVQHHLSQPITAEEIAEALYLNRSYLSRKFKAETGENLTDFILREKVQEARRLLRYSDKSLTAISTYLGFSSPSHFSRVFKKYTGSTPREYQEKYQ